MPEVIHLDEKSATVEVSLYARKLPRRRSPGGTPLEVTNLFTNV